MYIILELEIKLEVSQSAIEYVDEDVFGPYNKQECSDKIHEIVDKTIARGYFTEVKRRSDNRVILSNGGSATRMFIVKEVNKLK